MGKKSRGKKAPGGAAADEVAEEETAPEEVLAEIESLLDGLRLGEAAALTGKSLEEYPDSRQLRVLQGEVEKATKHLSASDISLSADGVVDGRGVRVAKRIKMGEAVLRERPLLTAPRSLVALGRKDALDDADIQAAKKGYSAVTSVQRRLLRGFHGWETLPDVLAAAAARQPDADAALRFVWVLALNSHQHRQDPAKCALYCLVARANHSCDPVCTLDEADGELVFYALRDMEEGEEVLYSYLGGHFTLHCKDVRQKQLRAVKFFDCRCPRCAEPEPPLQLPCAAEGCSGFAVQSAGEGPWRCQACGAEDPDDASAKVMARRMEPLLVQKMEALEKLWASPEKDPTKYVSDWEAVARSCGKALGGRHPQHGRALFFASMALNTGFALGGCGVDAARHAAGMREFGLALVDYLDISVPPGARRVLLEPFAQAVVLMAARSPGQEELIGELIRRAGADELRLLPWLDEKNIQLLRKTVASHAKT